MGAGSCSSGATTAGRGRRDHGPPADAPLAAETEPPALAEAALSLPAAAPQPREYPALPRRGAEAERRAAAGARRPEDARPGDRAHLGADRGERALGGP